ncbi:MAG: type II toxin-antitoxin system VapC family toxin, partial [Candidatus Paceibacterales bacterium]
LLDQLQTGSAFVPTIWSLELGNILIGAERKKRISYADITQFLELLSTLSIRTDEETSNRAFHEILLLAHSEKLTTYDAAYLELAMRLGLPLATKNIALQKAADKLGVKLL